LVIVAVAVPAMAGKPYLPDPSKTDLAASRSVGEAARYFGENLFTVDAGSSTGSVVLLGVEYVNGEYWVTGAGVASNTEPNYLWRLDGSGTVLNQYTQPTSSTWGWRDLAYDGTYLYASDSALVEQIDPATGTATGVTIPCPLTTCRALAYVPATDHFWTADFSSTIFEFDRTGTVINSFANSLSLYGFAFDGTSLWGCSQDPGVTVTQIDPATGTPTGVSFNGDGSGGGTPIAGGCSWSDTVVPGYDVLVAMHQADSDTIVGYDLDVGTPPPSCDSPDFNIIFEEAFDGGFPGVMNVVNNGGNCVWTDEVGGQGNLTGGSGSLGDADSDFCGSGTTMNTTMTTPAIAIGGASDVFIEFNQDYNNLSTTNDYAEVEVSADGTNWTQVWFRDSDESGPSEFLVDVSAVLGGATDGYVRFTYVAGGWYWWWQVDNIQVCIAQPAGESDLDLTKTATATSPDAGRYTLTIQNLGPDDATGVTVTDTLPAGVTYVSDDCGGVPGTPWTWSVGALANGAAETCNIEVSIVDPANTDNLADCVGDQNDPNSANNSSSTTMPDFGGPIPTLGSAGIMLLILLIAGVGLFLVRRTV
jgi:uncharacterized repeat protein (TIGR01451 family)